MGMKLELDPKCTPMASAAIAVLTIFLFIQGISAHVLPEGVNCLNVVCPVADRPECVCDYMSCHYWCNEPLPIVPQIKGEAFTNATIAAGRDLAYTRQLRNGILGPLNSSQANDLIAEETSLDKYYQDLLKTDPKGFWPNWDYAQLRMRFGDYESADRLYYTAISSLDPAAKAEISSNLRASTMGKLKLTNDVPETSSFISKLKDNIREAIKGRDIPLPKQDDYENEKLTRIGKIAKKVGVCDEPSECNNCVSGLKKVSGCIIDSIIGAKNQ